MTKPKWMRKRAKVTNLLDEIMHLSWQRGELRYRIGNRTRIVSFKTKDDTTNKEKYVKFFSSILVLINDSYTKIRKGELTRKEEKFLMNSDEATITYAAIDAIYEKWNEIEKELTKIEDLKIKDEVSV